MSFPKPGLEELRQVRRQSRGLYWAVALFSIFTNLLMLTGPLYMLQIYDRVLSSRSVETLIALTLLVAFLYGMMGILDYVRGRVMARVGARFQAALDRRVFDAMVRRSAVSNDPAAQTGLADLESIQRLIASPVSMSAFDIPWTPIFLAGITLFHPWLGILAMSGGAVLIVITWINQSLSRRSLNAAGASTHGASLMANGIRNEAETVRSMGMQDAAFERWKRLRDASLIQSVSANDVNGSFTSLTKTLRLFLQSAMLGLGAYLVLLNELTPGAMIAGSILLGRALAPIELAIGQWAVVQRARLGWARLGELLAAVPPQPAKTELPRPKAKLNVQNLTVLPPGETRGSLRAVSFKVEPGVALGVIGPSGAGKSTLARALTGMWPAAGGYVRLDGAALDQYDTDALGNYIGYLPQRIQLFDGTIAENISRLSTQPDDKLIVAAAKKAGVHDMIVEFPDGYDTRLTSGGGRLSGGQIQRIGLARAMYGNPVLLILDEPNSNLDHPGSEALNKAILEHKQAGGSVMVMAHRPSGIQNCDQLLVLDNGMAKAFGPKDQIMREAVKNHMQLQKATGMGGEA